MIKKIIAFLIFTAFTALLSAAGVNIMTVKGGVVFGEIIGSDETAVYVKISDGSAKTVPYSNIKKIFDNDTRKDITADYKKTAASNTSDSPAIAATAVPAVVQKEKKVSIKSQNTATTNELYETIEGESGTINLRPDTGIFVRTVPKYIGFGIDFIRLNFLFSSGNSRLKKMVNHFAVDTDGYTKDDLTMMLSGSLDGYVYIRPIDCFAIGGFYDMSPMNQNFSVYQGGEHFFHVDMPTTDYGVLIRLIPFSQGMVQPGGEAVETSAIGFNIKIGVTTLGTIFSAASLSDEAGQQSADLSGQSSYFGVEFFAGSPVDCMQFAFGYKTSLIDTITVSNSRFAQVADPYYNFMENSVLHDAGGKIPFSAQAIYMTMTLAF
jgi:hypothetical protein